MGSCRPCRPLPVAAAVAAPVACHACRMDPTYADFVCYMFEEGDDGLCAYCGHAEAYHAPPCPVAEVV